MPNTNIFVIQSELTEHRLSLDGRQIGAFATLVAAEKEATDLAQRAVPGAKLRFELDFKWTLSDLEIRVATVELDNVVARGSACGS